MKRFLTFYQKDKQNIKMINQTDKGFELVFTSDDLLKNFLEKINTSEEQKDNISIVWQMKFKKQNFIVYKNCVFSAPMDNYRPVFNYYTNTKIETVLSGKKIKVVCSGTSYYSDSFLYKDRMVKKTKSKYKDASLLTRMIKISELNFKSQDV